MKKRDTIHKAMGITYLAYENCIDTHFNDWCRKYSFCYAIPLRKLVVNDHLYNWYCDQWIQKVELPFYLDHQDYLEAGIIEVNAYQDLLLQYADVLQTFYPKMLLLQLKKEHNKTTA
ncbi:hypothetical protein [Cellulophaga lytica]|uniref:hypothetical protein n=1 Tax=Cellulophaga lytica TaxID=979 RepID=UPI003CE4BB22